jgi:Flp pilus assembly protein TadG
MKRAFGHSQAGLAIVEFALAVPLLLLILVGLVETGRFAYYSILVGNAARAGVQYGAQNIANAQDDTGMQAAATNDAQNIADITARAGRTCACTNGTATNTQSCSTGLCPLAGYHRVVYVWVTASGTFSSLFRYPGIPQSLRISRTATMRVSE